MQRTERRNGLLTIIQRLPGHGSRQFSIADELGSKMSDMSEDFLDLSEPDFEAPPIFADQDERRMHVRAYNYWASLLRGREFPSVTDLDPASLDDFGPHSVLLDFTEDRENPRLRYIGGLLREECGLSSADIALDRVPSRSLISRLTDHFFEIIANRAPIGFEAEFVSQRGNNTLYRGILMPLSSDGDGIDFIYGVINWKELAGTEFEAQLAFEAHEVEGDDAVIAYKPDAAVLELEPGDLAGRLAVARANAAAVQTADQRSRAALYRALGNAYDFHLASEDDPEGFAGLLAEAGLKVQARAPLTAVAKLVFGADYDKTRLTEFASALGAAVRAGVPAGGFIAFVVSAEGGLKGLVQRERAARAKPAVKQTTETVRVRLRSTEPLAHIDLQSDEEFVLLVAKKSDSGGIDVLEAVPHTKNLLEVALKRLAAH